MTPRTKMHFRSLLACAVLLTLSAFNSVFDGGIVAVPPKVLGHFPPRMTETLYRRCSDGPLSCMIRGYSQQTAAALKHRGGEYGVEVSQGLKVIPQDLTEDQVGGLVAGTYQVRNEDLTQRKKTLTLPDLRALELPKEQLLFVLVPQDTSEKQESSVTGDTVLSARADRKAKGSDMLQAQRGTAAAPSSAVDLLPDAPKAFFNPKVWMTHAKNASSLLLKKVLASLRHAAISHNTAAIRSKDVPGLRLPTIYGGSLDEVGKACAHCGPLGGNCQVPIQRLYNNTCPAAVAPKRALGCRRRSFLHKIHEESHSGPHRPGVKQRPLEKKERMLCPYSDFQAGPCQPFGKENTVHQRATLKRHKILQQQISHRRGVEERTLAQLARHLEVPPQYYDDANSRDAYSLIEVWGGESQELTQSQHTHRAQRSVADSYSNIQVREHNRLLNHDSLVTITYHFPFQTAESQSIAFILVALPPGYVALDDNLCTTHDFSMPVLSCRLRQVDFSERERGAEAGGNRRTLFVQVSSADKSRELPLGTHSFSVGVRNPAHRLAVGLPKNWWFITFRFSAGHTITKHFENGLLHEKRKCAWTSWRQETPCSASCGPGYEMWTRSLLAGDDGDCGPEIVKRRCELVPCNVNCQLGPWETVIDCTKPCLAQRGKAFQLSVRQVLLDKQGSGVGCEHLYPWNEKLKQGWSEKLRLVARRSPCPDLFLQPCPADLGCRVERRSDRTITVRYPWGSCPFPCGGIGRITSIIQVANGIPRWIGEREFPSSFQAPCRADREPVVKRQPCNTFACEDCSIYLEASTPGKALKAWFFFLPSQAADIVTVIIPPGSSFALDDLGQKRAATDREAVQQTHEINHTTTASDEKWGELEAASEHRSLAAGSRPEQTLEDITAEQDIEEGAVSTRRDATKEKSSEPRFPDSASLCRKLHASFGQVWRCYVRASTRYQMSQELVFQLRQPITPHLSGRAHQPSQQLAEGKPLTPRRPEWLVVPLRLNDRMSTEKASNFHMWLTSNHRPRDPEVFTCRVKMPMRAPVDCRYTYSPVHPEDCNNCSQQSSNRVLLFRQFSPPENGGTCNIPQERWQAGVALVVAACSKGCARVQKRTLQKHGSVSPGFSAAGMLGADISLLSGVSSERPRFKQLRNPQFLAPSAVRSVLSLQMRKAAVRPSGHTEVSEDV